MMKHALKLTARSHPQAASMRAAVFLPLLLGLSACSPNGCGAELPTFGEAALHEGSAFLSVGGTGPDDVWVVGAQPFPTEMPTVLHSTGGAFAPVEVPGLLHDLWWVHAFEDGPVFMGGGGATVLKLENGEFERTPTPVFFGNTVYGVWGSSPTDVWAVGGFAGRDGFAWRYDGEAWEVVDLPDDLPRAANGDIPALFKVWGRSADDVWIVGGLGAVLHWDGTRLERVDAGTEEQLFTVAGTDDEVAIVGGGGNGLLLRGGLDGFTEDTPPQAPLLQAVTFDTDGTLWTAGGDGFAARKISGADWELVDLNLGEAPQSIHALWSDGEGGIWGAGGGVLSPTLDKGVVCGPEDTPLWEPEAAPAPDLSCPADRVDIEPDASMARRWIELLFDSIRRDIPHPPVHARNIHHTSVAMYDAWAAYQDVSDGVIYTDRHTDADVAEARDIALSFAAYRVLSHRYAKAIGAETSLDCYDQFMVALGLDPMDDRVTGDDPVAVGNRIGFAVIDRFANDGANEANDYVDTTGWEPANPVMIVDVAGTNVEDPDVWQQLNLGTAETQNGIVLDDSVQPYIGPQWQNVEPFAIEKDPVTGLYSDPGDRFPSVNDPLTVEETVQVIAKTAELDVRDGVMVDIGPGSLGDNSLGLDDGDGYDLNPVTGEPYAPNMVPRGDFTRVVAEIWADGPKSTTPPGHWMGLVNEVSDRLGPDDLVPYGIGDPVDRLTWDVNFYLAVSGALHDAAISAWELKRDSLGARPITLIRWMGQNGQRSDENLPSYSPDGLPLVPGLIEVITEESSAPGERHHHLRWYVGEIALWSWPGEPGDREADFTPLRWMRAKDWIPYQRRTFVTPAFPGFTSGHSTFSRAAAEAMAAYTGSPWFPGGLHSFTLPSGNALIFEAGPTVDVTLQWASFFDASDQAGQSRLWGGIHVFADDTMGRINGSRVGITVAEKARTYWDGTAD
jgi:hypothetical protein